MLESRSVGRRRAALIGGVAIAALAALSSGPPELRGISLGSEGARVEIGAVRFGWSIVGAALAQAPADVTLTDLTFTLGPATYRVPRAEFTGVALSRDELSRLLDPNAPEPMAARLARLNARQITIPELIAEQRTGGGRAVTTQRDLVLRDVVAGRVGSMTSPSTTITSDVPEVPSGSYGLSTAADIDLAATAAIYTEQAGGAPQPMRRLYGHATTENVVLRYPQGVELRLARAELRDFQGRPTATPLAETVKLLSEVKPGNENTPEENRRLFTALADVLDAFDVGSLELSGLSLDDTRPEPQVGMKLARLVYTGNVGGQPSETRAEGLEIKVPDPETRLGLGSLSLTGFGFGTSLRGMAELASKKPEEFTGAEIRRLIPQLGTVRVQDLAVETREASEEGNPGAPLRYTVRGIELAAGRQLNAIPTNLRYSLDGLAMTLPADTEDAGLKNLVELGYRELQVSTLLALNWEEAASEVALQEWSVRAAKMGSVTLRGTVGQVGRDAFSPDGAVATVALLGATAKNLNIVVEDDGLLQNIVTAEARRQNRKPEEIRQEYASAASLGIPAVLGNSAAAKQVGQAVAKFVTAPRRLTISLRAKEPGGLGFADFAALNQPTDVLDRLDVTAIAE